jgi:hypothetical protein
MSQVIGMIFLSHKTRLLKMTKDKILDTKITTTVFGKKQEITYREYCAISGIPEEIMLWRIEKGVCQSRLLVKPTHILFYDGQYCTAGMLSERFKVSESALVNRWMKRKHGITRNGLRRWPEWKLGRQELQHDPAVRQHKS